MVTTKKPARSDRHKPSRMVRIPEAFAQELERMAADQMTTLSEQVRTALRSFLTRSNRWPPKPAK